jgi:hypothetical protein
MIFFCMRYRYPFLGSTPLSLERWKFSYFGSDCTWPIASMMRRTHGRLEADNFSLARSLRQSFFYRGRPRM